ncbi:hypothetical protein [Streptomyces sp. NPDC089915]|uniref:hypothetical protein n=1 Tax=Streptomyces sp. NPDC089915 TaxID=3155186 RepID=UPI0034223A03
MEEDAPWKNLGTIGLRLVDLTLRYTATAALAWVLTNATLPEEFDILGELPYHLMITGIPSVLISFVYGLASGRTGMDFRAPLALLLLLPLWWTIGFPPLVYVLAVGQVAFALGVMRAPFKGPSRLRRFGRAALARCARRGAAPA